MVRQGEQFALWKGTTPAHAVLERSALGFLCRDRRPCSFSFAARAKGEGEGACSGRPDAGVGGELLLSLQWREDKPQSK